MDIFKIIFGVCSVFLAWVVVFRTNTVIRINTWIKATVLSDQFILFSKRRMAVLLLLLGFLALFSGIDGLEEKPNIKPHIAELMLENAKNSYGKQQYKRTIEICKQLVLSNDENLEAWAILASAWWTRGEKKQAFAAANRVHIDSPDIVFKQYPLLTTILEQGKTAG